LKELVFINFEGGYVLITLSNEFSSWSDYFPNSGPEPNASFLDLGVKLFAPYLCCVESPGHLAWMLRIYRHSQKLSPNFQIKGVKIQGGSRPLVFIPEI